MMEKMKKQQAVAWTKKREQDRKAANVKRRRIEKIRCEAWKYGLSVFIIIYLTWLIWAVVQIRIEVYPELGRCLIPKGSVVYNWYNNLKWIDCEFKPKEEN
jgi:hypothetical protein